MSNQLPTPSNPLLLLVSHEGSFRIVLDQQPSRFLRRPRTFLTCGGETALSMVFWECPMSSEDWNFHGSIGVVAIPQMRVNQLVCGYLATGIDPFGYLRTSTHYRQFALPHLAA